jgi:hypothetical protein
MCPEILHVPTIKGQRPLSVSVPMTATLIYCHMHDDVGRVVGVLSVRSLRAGSFIDST